MRGTTICSAGDVQPHRDQATEPATWLGLFANDANVSASPSSSDTRGRHTLTEVSEANLLLHVIDASHTGWEEQREVVDQVLGEIGIHGAPVLYVFNKTDWLSDAELGALAGQSEGDLLESRLCFRAGRAWAGTLAARAAGSDG